MPRGMRPRQLGEAVLRQVRLSATHDQRAGPDVGGEVPPRRVRVVAPAPQRGHRPPVAGLPRFGSGRDLPWRIGRERRRHVLQHQGPYAVGMGRGQQVGDHGAHRVSDHGRGEHTQGVHRLQHVIAQVGQLVRGRPVALAMTAGVQRDHPEPPAETRSDQRPVVGVGPEPVQQDGHRTIGATPLPIAQREAAGGGQLVAYDGRRDAHSGRLSAPPRNQGVSVHPWSKQRRPGRGWQGGGGGRSGVLRPTTTTQPGAFWTPRSRTGIVRHVLGCRSQPS